MKQTVDVRVPVGAVLNENDRLHWAPKRDRTAQVRALGRSAGRMLYRVPDGIRVRIEISVWKGRSSHYDPANLAPTAKAIVDGFRDARVLVDDDWKHVDGPHLTHGGVNAALLGRAGRSAFMVFTVTLTDVGATL